MKSACTYFNVILTIIIFILHVLFQIHKCFNIIHYEDVTHIIMIVHCAKTTVSVFKYQKCTPGNK